MNLKFTQYVDMTDICDSMQLDSGTTICTLECDKGTCSIEVRGEVSIDFNGTRYKVPSEFPPDLKEIVRLGGLANLDNPQCKHIKGYDSLYINFNNWFEAFWNTDPEHRQDDYDVVDIEHYTPDQLLGLCIECLKLK